MRRADTAAVERVIANTIYETAQGDPQALASRVVAALAEAGYSIVPANGVGTGGACSMKPFYRSPNGDTWFLARDPETGVGFVRHQANAPSGGQVTDLNLGAFLSGERHPEHEALRRLVGSSIPDPRDAEKEVATAANRSTAGSSRTDR